jgi:hypothetical protein
MRDVLILWLIVVGSVALASAITPVLGAAVLLIWFLLFWLAAQALEDE